MTCLTDREIELFARQQKGDLSNLMELEAHLANCQDCQSKLADENLFAELQIAIGRSARSAPPVQTELLAIEEGPIDGYRILEEIHRGGQGVVYKAIQDATSRVVALKILLQGSFASERQRRRFEREIDVAASLKHSNIVTVYDSGISRNRPYFAMEYVEGQSLDSHIELTTPRLSGRTAKQRKDARLRVLKMFRSICEALAHAHQRGIIHRDLKPSNIRLEEDGEPRVLDFGLAKLAIPDGDSDPLFQTREGEFLGTLAYAAPEQTFGDPNAVDVRSDVYALGMILYELLTGTRPYSVDGDLSQALKNIRLAEAGRPSAFDPGIDDDLDTIVLKAVSKEPQRRYQSAHELWIDIGNYLRGEAINAKRDSSWYLLNKTIRRHRTAFATAGLFLAVISIALIVSLAFWRQAVIDRNDAIEAGGVAKRAMKTAQQKSALAVREGRAAIAARDEAEFQAYAANIAAAEGALRNLDVAEARMRLDNAPEKHRDWEWHFLRRQLDASTKTYSGHSSYVEQIRYLQGRDTLISTGWDRSLRGWDATSGEQLFEIQVSDPLWSLAVSGDERFVAAGDWNHTVRVWDIESQEELFRITAPTRRLPSLAFHPNQELLLVGCWPFGEDEEQIAPQILCIDLQSRDVKRTIEMDEVPHHLRFSTDGKTLYTSEQTRTGVWNAKTLEREQEIDGRMLALSKDGLKYINTDGRRVWLRDTATGEQLAELAGHRGEVFCAAFSDSSQWIATGGRDKSVRIWDTQSGDLVQTYLGHQWTVTSVCFDSESQHIFSASWDQTVKRWEVGQIPSAKRVQAHESAITDLRISNDGQLLASCSMDMSVKLWHLTSRSCVATLQGHNRAVQSIAFSDGDERLASACWDGTVRIWNLAELPRSSEVFDREVASQILNGHHDLALGVAFHPTTGDLLSCSRDNTIRVWDVESSELLRVVHGHDDHVHSMAFNESGTLLASSGHRSIRLWDAKTYQPICMFDRNILREDYSLAFSPIDETLVAGFDAKTLRYWDTERHSVVESVYAHTDEIYSVRFSPDDARMVSVASDATVKVWDLAHRLPLLTLTSPTSEVQRVAFSRDGKLLIGGLQSGELIFWDGGENEW